MILGWLVYNNNFFKHFIYAINSKLINRKKHSIFVSRNEIHVWST